MYMYNNDLILNNFTGLLFYKAQPTKQLKQGLIWL